VIARLRLLLVGAALLTAAPAVAQPLPTDDLKRLSIEELMRIDVTTAARRSEPIGITPAAITVITSDDIRRSGVTTIADALRLADSVHVAQTSNASWNITARGFNQGTANKLLVMIDGRTVYSPLFTGVFWNTVDYVLEDIERIEVIRGPGATLWGANAVNGVINIITRHSRSTRGAYLTASAGNEESALALRYGGSAGTATWRVYGKFVDSDAQVFASGLPSNDGRRRGQAGFRIDGGGAGATNWMIKGDAFHSRDGFVNGQRGEFTEIDAQARWSRALANESRIDLQSYYRREFRRQDGQFTHHVDIVDFDAQHAVGIGSRHALVYGGGIRVNWDNSHGSDALRLDPPSRTHGLASGFIQDEIALLPERWFATVGTKWEYNSFSGGALQPSVRTRVMLPRGQVLWGAVSRANRRPSRLEDDLVVAAGSTPIVGSDDFLPERLLAVEAGYRVQPRRELSIDTSIFRHNFTDLRSIDQPPAGLLPLVLANSFTGHSHGVELGLNLQPVTWWRTHVGYTWLDTAVEAQPGTRPVGAGASEANDPHHLFLVRTSIDLPKSVDLDASFHGVGELPSPVVPGVAALGLRLAWRATATLELFVSGQNLLDASHPEFGAPSAMRVEIERTVRAGLTIRY
jgi:iron complex outermembrane receptor protein